MAIQSAMPPITSIRSYDYTLLGLSPPGLVVLRLRGVGVPARAEAEERRGVYRGRLGDHALPGRRPRVQGQPGVLPEQG